MPTNLSGKLYRRYEARFVGQLDGDQRHPSAPLAQEHSPEANGLIKWKQIMISIISAAVDMKLN